MKTVTIELLNEEALLLLKQLEQLNILRLLKSDASTATPNNKEWAGSISKESAKKMLQKTEQERNDWDRCI